MHKMTHWKGEGSSKKVMRNVIDQVQRSIEPEVLVFVRGLGSPRNACASSSVQEHVFGQALCARVRCCTPCCHGPTTMLMDGAFLLSLLVHTSAPVPPTSVKLRFNVASGSSGGGSSSSSSRSGSSSSNRLNNPSTCS